MGRNKIKIDKLKRKISITISPEIDDRLELLKINKSKLINSLIDDYLKRIKYEKNEME